MAQFSFDIVSEYDKAEMNNVFDQAQRELENRYDFKGTPAALEWLDDKKGLKVIGSGDWQIDAILDIVRKKLSVRGISQKVLDTSKDATESNLKTTKEVIFKAGLDQDKAKSLTKLIREDYPKVKTQIQGDAVRVMSGSKDDLQAVMQLIRATRRPGFPCQLHQLPLDNSTPVFLGWVWYYSKHERYGDRTHTRNRARPTSERRSRPTTASSR